MRITKALTLAALGATLIAAPAAAQDGKPLPTCGAAFADAAGDTASQADNLDLVGGYFSYGDDGSVRANIVVKNLSTEYPGSANGIRWRFTFTVNGKAYYVGVFRDIIFEPLADPYYDWGTFDGGTESFVGIADGAMFEGENGVISVLIPPEIALEDGFVLTDAAAYTESYTTLGVTEVTTAEDSTEGAAGTFTVGPCVLDVRLASTAPLKAAKAARSRKATIRLSSGSPVTGLEATLRRGTKVVGTGRLAKLDGNGKLTLKLRKGFKKGEYTLALAGTGAGGGAATTELTVAFR